MIEAGRPLIVGLGHRYRRDDAVGPLVAEALAARGLDARAHEGDGLGLLELWDGRARCLMIDALADAARAGAILRLPADPSVLRAAGFVHSSHRIGLPEAVALGRSLGRLPANLEVIAVAGRDFAFGDEPSPEVRRAADALVAELVAEAGLEAVGL